MQSENGRIGGAFINRMTQVHALGPMIALVLLIIVLSVLTESFFTFDNLFNVVQQSSINLIIGLGMTLVIISGGIDLSVGSVMALVGCSMALISKHWPVPPLFAIALGLLFGVLVGAFNGFVISRTGIPDFIMTVGMLSAARGLALIITGGLPVTGLPEQVTYFGAESIGPIPVAGIVALVMAVFAWFVLKYTKLGRNAYAIGGNREAARAAGIDVKNYKVYFYAFIGLMVAVAATVQVGRIFSANPLMGARKELEVIAVVILGGTNLFGGQGTIGGTILGALIIGIIGNGLNLLNVSSFWQDFVIGTLIIVVVIIDRLRHRGGG